MSVSLIPAVLALVLAIVSGITGRVPLWIAVVLLALTISVPGWPVR